MLPSLLAAMDPAAPLAQMVIAGVGLVWLLIILLTSIFWIWMLIDAIVSPREPLEKLVWVLVILFTHILGAIIYFVIGRGGSNRSAV